MAAHHAIAPIVDTRSTDRTEDVGLLVERVSEGEGPVVERAVGTGRATIPAATRKP